MGRSSDAVIRNEDEVDITGVLQSSLLSVSVTQRLHGRADEMSLSLEDQEGLWRDEWRPSSGERLSLRFEVSDWREEGDDRSVEWGTYVIDSVTLSGPPATANIKAQSASVSESMRKQKRTQAWQGTSLEEIAREIAGRHDLDLVYRSERNPAYNRKDQSETPDITFLRREADRFNVKVRVDDDRLILITEDKLKRLAEPIYRSDEIQGQERAFEAKVLTCKRWELEERSYKMARESVVSYDDPTGNTKRTGTAEDPEAPDTAETLEKNERVETQGKANLRAAALLEKNNQEQFMAPTVTVPGRPELRPGWTVPIKGFGRFDDRYIITQTTHRISKSSGYETKASLRIQRDLLT